MIKILNQILCRPVHVFIILHSFVSFTLNLILVSFFYLWCRKNLFVRCCRLKVFDFLLSIRAETCGNWGKRAKTQNCLSDRKWLGKRKIRNFPYWKRKQSFQLRISNFSHHIRQQSWKSGSEIATKTEIFNPLLSLPRLNWQKIWP